MGVVSPTLGKATFVLLKSSYLMLCVYPANSDIRSIFFARVSAVWANVRRSRREREGEGERGGKGRKRERERLSLFFYTAPAR